MCIVTLEFSTHCQRVKYVRRCPVNTNYSAFHENSQPYMTRRNDDSQGGQRPSWELVLPKPWVHSQIWNLMADIIPCQRLLYLQFPRSANRRLQRSQSKHSKLTQMRGLISLFGNLDSAWLSHKLRTTLTKNIQWTAESKIYCFPL